MYLCLSKTFNLASAKPAMLSQSQPKKTVFRLLKSMCQYLSDLFHQNVVSAAHTLKNLNQLRNVFPAVLNVLVHFFIGSVSMCTD